MTLLRLVVPSVGFARDKSTIMSSRGGAELYEDEFSHLSYHV